jgi:hypothetical protein
MRGKELNVLKKIIVILGQNDNQKKTKNFEIEFYVNKNSFFESLEEKNISPEKILEGLIYVVINAARFNESKNEKKKLKEEIFLGREKNIDYVKFFRIFQRNKKIIFKKLSEENKSEIRIKIKNKKFDDFLKPNKIFS